MAGLMFEVIFSFLLAALISFIGSLQPGPVNLTVLHLSARKNYSRALFVSFGGSLPEFIFCFIAMRVLPYTGELASYHDLVTLFVSSGLVIAGVFIFMSPVNEAGKKDGRVSGFITGCTLALFNPQLFMFWLIILFKLQPFSLNISHVQNAIAFASGAAAGAFLLHISLLNAVIHREAFTNLYIQFGNRLSGALFILAGMATLIAGFIGYFL